MKKSIRFSPAPSLFRFLHFVLCTQRCYHIPEPKRWASFPRKNWEIEFSPASKRGIGSVTIYVQGKQAREDKVTSGQDASIAGNARGRITPWFPAAARYRSRYSARILETHLRLSPPLLSPRIFRCKGYCP